MWDFIIKFTCSFLLIFFFFIIIFLKKSKEVKQKNKEKYPTFCIANFFSKFKHIKYVKKGELVSFRCEGELNALEKILILLKS